MGAVAFFIPACLVSNHVDVVLMFHMLKASTPKGRSISWWRLLKFKYTHLSTDLAALNWLTMLPQTTSEQASLHVYPLPDYDLPQRRHPAASGKCVHLPLWLCPSPPHWCQRPVHSYLFLSIQMKRTIPSRVRRQPVPIKALRKLNKNLQPPEARQSRQPAQSDVHVLLNMANWRFLLMQLAVEMHLQGAFLSQCFPVQTSQRRLYFPWRFLPGFQIKAGEWQGQGDLHHFSCRVRLLPPSLLYDPASTHDALSHHLHHL